MSTAARSGRVAAPDRASAARRRAGAWAGASALLYATTADVDGEAAALARIEDATIAGRLLAQLETLGVRRVWIVTRPAWADAVRRATADAPMPVDVIAADDVSDDLRAAARAAGEVTDRLVIGRADVVAHREALAGLLVDPRVTTGVLATNSSKRSRWAYRTRSARGRMLSASSPFHSVRRPSGYFLGFLKVDPRDLAALRAAAGRLADLTGGPERASFEDELARKVAIWRRRQWQLAVQRETELWPDPEDIPLDPELEPEAEVEVAERLRATRDDAGAMLLVGLVRSGVHVSSSYLRNFFYARPRSPEEIEEALAELAEIDEDDVLLDAAVKGADGFFTTYFVSPYSKYIARFAARHGWTPNVITTVSMAIGLAAAAAFALGSRASLIAGAVLLQAAFTMDCVDGQLARYSRQFSKLGAWLDSIFDRGKEYVVYAGLAIGSTHGFGVDVWTLAAAAIALQTSRHMVDFSYAAGRHEAIAALPLRDLAEPDERDGPPPQVESEAEAVAEAEAEAAEGTAIVPEAPLPERRGVRAVAARAVRLITHLEKHPVTRWAKRIVALPIGERFALISITAALWSPRTTFVALLAWGGFAACYSVGGRILRSVAR
jgi:phosphatidylglycerophosphate synthase/choline kinase